MTLIPKPWKLVKLRSQMTAQPSQQARWEPSAAFPELLKS